MGILSFEDEDLVNETGDAVTAELIQADVDTQPAGEEVEALQGEVDEGIGATDDLQKVGDAVAATLDDGGEGLNEQAAAVTEISVECIMYRLGAKSPVLSVESFASAASRRQATVLTLQGIMSTVKKAWEKLKQLLKTLWEKFRTWISQVVGFVKVGRDTAAKIVARLQKKRGAEASSKTLTGKSYCAFFTVDGKASLSTVKAGIENTIKNIDGVSSAYKALTNTVEGVKKEVLAVMDKAATGGEVKSDAAAIIGGTVLEAYNAVARDVKTLSFGRGITASVNVESVNGKPKAKLEVKLPAKFEAAKEIEVAEIDATIALLGEIQKLSDAITKFGDEKGATGNLKSSLTKATDDILNIISSTEKKDDAADSAAKVATANAAKFANETKDTFTATQSLTSDISHKVITYAKEALREALLYAAAVEGAYKLKDE